MKKQIKLLILLAVAVVAVAAFFVFKPSPTSQSPAGTVDQATKEATKSIEYSYLGQDGKNALEILKSSYNVETKTSDGLGEFVTSIDGRVPDDKHFWAFYVNGEQSQVGASSYITKSTDAITWKLEEIK